MTAADLIPTLPALPADVMAALWTPGIVLMLAGLVAAIGSQTIRAAALLLGPLLAFLVLLDTPVGTTVTLDWLGFELTPVRHDRLSLVFVLVFLLAALLAGVYALHSKSRLEVSSALIYAGAAVGAVMAGDLVTLFIYWELTAIASVFLIWVNGTDRAYRAGMRYLLVQVISGLLLIGGAVVIWRETGTLAFDRMALESPATWAIFVAFGIKAAFPLLNGWMQDGYPEGSVIGTVVLSAFTTKLAIYALARGFPGTELLIPIGAAMAVWPAIPAILETDLRRVLAYALNCQLGFMVVGIGVGTAEGINGAVGHAFASTLYQGLLYMATGAVLFRMGTVEVSRLGGLARAMPLTAAFCIVGAAAMAAAPLFSSYVVKSLTLSAAAHEGHYAAYVALIVAGGLAVVHGGLKVPYLAFFAPRRGPAPAEEPREAPANMLIAMALAAGVTVGLGVSPTAFYALLPFPVDYAPYKTASVLTQLQLLVFAALAFALLLRWGLVIRDRKVVVLNTDWLYRVPGRFLAVELSDQAAQFRAGLARIGMGLARDLGGFFLRTHGPEGVMARPWPIGLTVMWVAIVLVCSLVLYYL